MSDPHFSTGAAERLAERSVRLLFESNGWKVEEDRESDKGADFVLTSPHGEAYHAVLKALTEGRADRAIPLFSQALLESRAHANACRKKARPAVLLWVGNASQALVNKLRDFQRAYGEGEPIAILSDIPLYVDFPGLKADEPRVSVRRTSHSAAPILVFSDLAQWMLKLLLAPDIKRANLIGAPDVILKQHPYPKSLLRGRVMREGLWVSDIIQTWLDVSADTTRGAEQAAELEHGVLANIV